MEFQSSDGPCYEAILDRIRAFGPEGREWNVLPDGFYHQDLKSVTGVQRVWIVAFSTHVPNDVLIWDPREEDHLRILTRTQLGLDRPSETWVDLDGQNFTVDRDRVRVGIAIVLGLAAVVAIWSAGEQVRSWFNKTLAAPVNAQK
jgi:hypothetical protein